MSFWKNCESALPPGHSWGGRQSPLPQVTQVIKTLCRKKNCCWYFLIIGFKKAHIQAIHASQFSGLFLMFGPFSSVRSQSHFILATTFYIFFAATFTKWLSILLTYWWTFGRSVWYMYVQLYLENSRHPDNWLPTWESRKRRKTSKNDTNLSSLNFSPELTMKIYNFTCWIFAWIALLQILSAFIQSLLHVLCWTLSWIKCVNKLNIALFSKLIEFFFDVK